MIGIGGYRSEWEFPLAVGAIILFGIVIPWFILPRFLG